MHVSVEPDPVSFHRCADALLDEATSEQWERDAAEEFAEALRPGEQMVKSALFAGMRTSGEPHPGERLRAGVADEIQPVEALRVGARLRVTKTYGLRGFINAPKRLNQQSWKRPAGRKQVTQVGAPGWFDKTLERLYPALQRAAERVLERRARRISRKAP